MLIFATVVCSPPPSYEHGETFSLIGYVTSFTPTRSIATFRESLVACTSGIPAAGFALETTGACPFETGTETAFFLPERTEFMLFTLREDLVDISLNGTRGNRPTQEPRL